MTLCPHIPYGEQHEEVVVCFAHLQETLTAIDVFHQEGGILPDAVGATHIYGSIEFPSRPWFILGRVGSAVEIHVVHTTGEHQVDIRFALRERCTEMLCEPCQSLTACQLFSCDVSSRRGIFEH